MWSNCWATLIELCVDSLERHDEGKVVLPWKKSAHFALNTLTSSSAWWYHTASNKCSHSEAKGAAKTTLRQKVDWAEVGTAWCIPLQTTHSLTSPLRKVSERPVGTTAGKGQLHLRSDSQSTERLRSGMLSQSRPVTCSAAWWVRPLPRWRWRRSRRWWPPGQRRRPPSAGCPPAWTSATGLPGNRSPQTTWRTRTLEKRVQGWC